MMTLAKEAGRRNDQWARDAQLQERELARGWQKEWSEADNAHYYFSSARQRSQWAMPRESGVYADMLAAYVGASQSPLGSFARAPAAPIDDARSMRLASGSIDSLSVASAHHSPAVMAQLAIDVVAPAPLWHEPGQPLAWAAAGLARLFGLLAYLVPQALADLLSPPLPRAAALVTHARLLRATIDPRHANAAAALSLLDRLRRIGELNRLVTSLSPRSSALAPSGDVSLRLPRILSWCAVALVLFAIALYFSPRSLVEKVTADGKKTTL
jgi:hypothetical protein